MTDSFIFYRSYEEAIGALPVKEQYKLYKAIIRMSLDDEIFELSGVSKAMFALILPQITANKKRYRNGMKGKEFGVRGKEFGVLGGRPRKDKNPPDNPPNENENENENKNENENENENANAADADTGTRAQCGCVQGGFVKSGKTGNKRNSPQIDYGAITEDYNQVCKSLPAVKCLTDARRTAIRARIEEHTAEKLHEVFVKAENSDFLCGRNRPIGRGPAGCTGRANGRDSPPAGYWRATFDWLINKSNFVKVLEGNYDNKPGEPWDSDDLFPD